MSSHLEDSTRKHKKIFLLCLICALILAMVTFVSVVHSSSLFFLGAIGLYTFFYKASKEYKGYKAYRAGIEGEHTLRHTLKKLLSDEYIALYNVPINEKGDIDCVLLGPSGLYAFEVKHYSGIISGSGNGDWHQDKVSQRGNVYHRGSFKPVGQLRAGIYSLKKYLRENGINVWIKGAVVFTHPNVELYVDSLKGIQAVKVDKIDSVINKGNVLPENVRKKIEDRIDVFRSRK